MTRNLLTDHNIIRTLKSEGKFEIQ